MPKPRTHRPRDPRAAPLAEMRRHLGEWVALVDRRVVASHRELGRALEQGRKASPGREPFMIHVLEEDSLLL